MAAIESHAGTQSEDIASELDDLKGDALRLVLVAVAVLAILSHYVVSTITDRVDPTRFGFMLAIVVTIGLGHWALRFGGTASAIIVTISLAVLLSAALLLYGAIALGYWFSPIVIVAGVLVDWRYGLGLAGFSSAVILADLKGIGAMPGDLATGALLLIWTSLLICWLLAHPTRTALGWAWHSYLGAKQITEELRDHQVKLERTVKSLNAAYDRLEQLNLELARARESAEQARRLKAEFAAGISHELRTPLNLIIGFSEMIVTTPRAYGGQVLPDVYRSDLEAIYRNAGHLSNLVDDVLDLSQIEADRIGLQKKREHLHPIVDEAVTTIARFFSAKGLSLIIEVPLDLPAIFVDRTRVRQVLINILNNAARFTTAGGVTIRAWSEGTDVIVAVADTGVGIAPESLPLVFDEFRQIHVLGERRPTGNGLGLALSKRLIELHGGSMWVESRLGEGSTFLFSLPSIENVIAAPVTDPGERWLPTGLPAAGTDPTVLVIDRDGSGARLISRHLDGHHVIVANGIEQARRLGADSAIHAAVTVSSTGLPHWDSIRQVADAFPDVPLGVCALKTPRVHARELGVMDCLVKPVTQEQIRRSLRRLGRGVRTILIVDDDIEMVRLLGRLVRLVSRKYEVWEAFGGQEALSLLEAKRPDAVLLDLILQDVNGDEILRRMRTNPDLGNIPVILVTGHGITDETVTADFFGITRPGGLSVRELMQCLQTSLNVVCRSQPALFEHAKQRLSTDGFGQEVGSAHRQSEGTLVDD